MHYPVIIRAESGHQYIAQPLGIPAVKVVAATEAEAIAQVTEAFGQWLAAAKVIHVTVPGEAHGNPWLDAFGRSATDPDFPESLKNFNACGLWIRPHDSRAPRHGSCQSA